MSNWAETVMLWHVYPLGFTGAPIRPDGADDDGQSNAGAADQPVEHRLSRIEDWLDHVVELGLNGLLLGPVFPRARTATTPSTTSASMLGSVMTATSTV